MRTGLRICAVLCALWAAAPGLAQSMSNRDPRAATIAPGAEPLLLEFTADPSASGGDLFHVNVPKPGVAISLLTPAGTEIDASNAEAQGYSFTTFEGIPNHASITGPLAIPGFHTVIELPPGSAPGSYRIKAAPAELGEETVILAVYTSSSAVRAAVTTGRPTYRAGDPVVFTGIFFDATEPLSPLTATLRIRPHNDPSAPAIDLNLEDSSEVDQQAGDGQYFGVWRPEQPGRYVAALKATGTSLSGVPFSRIAATEFRVLPPLARIESIRDTAVDDDGDGLPNRIVIEVNLDVMKAGEYRVLLNVRASEQAVVLGRQKAKLEEGKARLDVAFPLVQMSPLRADGPYTITDVLLLYLDDPEPPVVDERANAGKTAPYPLTELLRSTASPITSSVAALGFGDVQTDSGRELTLTLRNRSQYAFTETVLRLADGPFSVVAPTTPFTVPAEGELALRVRFRPVAVGQRTATLNVAGINIALSGNGVAPRIVVNPTRLDFGRVAANQTKDLTLTVRNGSDTPLTITSGSVTGARFAVTSPAMPFTVGVAIERSITVRFAPNAAGEQSGLLRIAAVDVPLIGVGFTDGAVPPSPEPPGPEPPPAPPPPPPPPPPDPTPGEFRITSIEPSTATAGDFGFTLTVNGAGFVQGAVVRWNTVNRPTTFVSATQLTAVIARADIASPGNASVTVANGAAVAGISNALDFPIAPAPAPTTSVRIQQFDRSDCPTVRVFASLLAPDGTPVERAPSNSFACSENGAAATCQTRMAGDSGIPASVVIVVSTNGLGAGIEAVRAAATGLVAAMGEGDRAALIHLESRASQLQGFTTDRNALLTTIGQLREAGEGNALLDAVNLATGLFASEQGRRQAVFLITHRDNQGGSITNPNTVLSNVRARGIPIYSVAFGAGLGSAALGSFLKSATADSHGVLVAEDATSNLASAAARLSRIFRAQYAVTFNSIATGPPTFRLSFTDSSGTYFAERPRPACGQ